VRSGQVGSGSGYAFRVDRQAGPVWYCKYRGPDGRQVKKRVGPAWTGRDRPAAGFFDKRTAEDWLDDALAGLRERALVGASGDGVTFEVAAREWLRFVEHDRGCKPTTLRGYRSSVFGQFVPVFGSLPVGEISPLQIERWRASLRGSARTKNKLLTELHGVFARAGRVYGIPVVNPAAQVPRLRERRKLDIDVFSPDEVRVLVRAAADEQDAAIFLTAAFTGLRRGELLALRWRDVDFAGSVIRVRGSYAANTLTPPKSGKVRAVPLAREVAGALALLGQRDRFVGDDDLVFPGEGGGYLDGSALRRRYLAAMDRAGLRRLRFHDLRHTFATAMIAKADIVRVQEWMGHADIQTTRRYLHYVQRPDDARLVDEAFATPELAAAA
jgi:integrase